MTTLATVRTWNADEGWGVLDSPDTPGGCWAHVSCIARPGPWYLDPGDEYLLEWESGQQDGFDHRAVRMWPVGTEPVDQVAGHDGTAYSSSLRLTFDDEG